MQVFTPQLTVSSTVATVAYNATTKAGSIAFKMGTADQTVSTTDGYDKVVSYSGVATRGEFKAAGNLLMLCTGTRNSDTYVALSSNLKPVTDITVARGKIFQERHCGGSTGTLTVNADGSITGSEGNATAAEVAAMFSDAGLRWVDGKASGTMKARGYSHTNSAGVVKYYVVMLNDEDTTDFVTVSESQ